MDCLEDTGGYKYLAENCACRRIYMIDFILQYHVMGIGVNM